MTKSLQNSLQLPTQINIIEVAKEFNFWSHTLTFDLLGTMAEKGEEISNEMYSYVINPPPIYAAKEDDVMKKIMNNHAERFIANRNPALEIVRLVKKEFYEFICTEKAFYKKQRNLVKGSATSVISGIAAIIATKLSSIEIGTITALVSAFLIVLTKMGTKIFCEIVKTTLVTKAVKLKERAVKKTAK